jgi:hypothetical protein
VTRDNAVILRELPERAPSYNVRDIVRAQTLNEMLASIAEYQTASPAFRPYWRRLALHDIARFRRDWLQPERAAFEAAVARQQARRIAA